MSNLADYCGWPIVYRLSGSYFYLLSVSVEPIAKIAHDTDAITAFRFMFDAERALTGLLDQSLVRLKTSRQSCESLRDALVTHMAALLKAEKWTEPIGPVIAGDVVSKHGLYRGVLLAELNTADFYALTSKGAFDTTKLAEEGISAFHPDLPSKVPTAIGDAYQAARCIAFELPTAAAFHLHRVNESVMRAYFDAVTGGKPRPESRNIGAYIDAMKNYQVGDKSVFGVLAMIKDHHRNPVLHPDESLETAEEAIALLGIIRTATELMLKKIPPAPLVLEPSPGP